MTIVTTLRGFNDLGRFGDPYFSFDGSFSRPIFYVLRKNEENQSSRSFNFLQNVPSNSVYFTSWLSCWSWKQKSCFVIFAP